MINLRQSNRVWGSFNSIPARGIEVSVAATHLYLSGPFEAATFLTLKTWMMGSKGNASSVPDCELRSLVSSRESRARVRI